MKRAAEAGIVVRPMPSQYHPMFEVACAPSYFRCARKEWSCWGGYDNKARKHTKCDVPIKRGEIYVEYCGEVAAFQSGKRYHLSCAVQQGLIARKATA